MAILFLLSKNLPDICWEKIAEEIFFHISSSWRCLARGLNWGLTSNKPSHYLFVINSLTADYEITRRLCCLLGCQTTSYLVFIHIKMSICRFLFSFLKITAAFNALKMIICFVNPYKFITGSFFEISFENL